MYRKLRIVESIANSVSQYELYHDHVYRYTPIYWPLRMACGSQYLNYVKCGAVCLKSKLLRKDFTPQMQ